MNILIIFIMIISNLILYQLSKYVTSGKQRINIIDAKKQLKNNNFDIVLDVRTNLEYNSGHYPNSLNNPFISISKDSVEQNIKNKNARILVYCNTGHRARYATTLLNDYGYKNVLYIAESYKLLL